MRYSDCCFCPTSHDEYGICPGCGEHCDFVEEEEEITASPPLSRVLQMIEDLEEEG